MICPCGRSTVRRAIRKTMRPVCAECAAATIRERKRVTNMSRRRAEQARKVEARQNQFTHTIERKLAILDRLKRRSRWAA